MSDNVVPLKIVEYGAGHIIAPDEVFERNKGKFSHVVVVGVGEDGNVVVEGSHGYETGYWLLAKGAKAMLA